MIRPFRIMHIKSFKNILLMKYFNKCNEKKKPKHSLSWNLIYFFDQRPTNSYM